jgi:hypothetical protein
MLNRTARRAPSSVSERSFARRFALPSSGASGRGSEVHLRQAAAQAGDGGRLLGDLAGAGGDGVRVLDGAAQVLLARVAEADVCVVTHHHASIICSGTASVIHLADELQVVPGEDRGPR